MILFASAVFACTPVHAIDGDTFRCVSGVTVRLAAIDAPEMAGHCRTGRKCAPGDPQEARRALQALVGGKTLRCTKHGTSWGRTVAWCRADRADLSCTLYRAGHVAYLRQYDPRRKLCRSAIEESNND